MTLDLQHLFYAITAIVVIVPFLSAALFKLLGL